MENNAPPKIFSKSRRAAIASRIDARQSQADAAEYLLQDATDDIFERLEFMRFVPKSALIIGDWSGLLGEKLENLGAAVVNKNVGDFDEELPFPNANFDLILHLFGIATVNDLPGALIHTRNALADDGLMVTSFPGAGSLPILRQIMLAADGDRPAARFHPLIDQKAAAGLLQRAGFKRQVVDSHTLSVRYSSLDRLVGDLRDHGLNSALKSNSPNLARQSLDRANAAFAGFADQDGKVTETFEMVTLTAWK